MRTLSMAFALLVAAGAASARDWRQARSEDRGISADFVSFYRDNSLVSADGQKRLESIVGQIWETFGRMAADQQAQAAALSNAIDEKASQGLLSPETADDLQGRLDKIVPLRLECIYGYMWRDAMRQAFDDDDEMPQRISAVVGERLKPSITAKECTDRLAPLAFDPARYSLPPDFFVPKNYRNTK